MKARLTLECLKEPEARGEALANAHLDSAHGILRPRGCNTVVDPLHARGLAKAYTAKPALQPSTESDAMEGRVGVNMVGELTQE